MAFYAGQIYRFKAEHDCNEFAQDDLVIITQDDDNYPYYSWYHDGKQDDSVDCSGHEESLELVNQGDNMSKEVTSNDLDYLALSADDRTLVDAGLIDLQGNFTSQGKLLSDKMLFEANKPALVKLVSDVNTARATDTPESK